MKIDHLAIWVKDLEKMKAFYTKYFNMKCGNKYNNEDKKISSYFLSFDSGARIEIMYRPDISEHKENRGITNGITHFAISVGHKEKVNNSLNYLEMMVLKLLENQEQQETHIMKVLF